MALARQDFVGAGTLMALQAYAQVGFFVVCVVRYMCVYCMYVCVLYV